MVCLFSALASAGEPVPLRFGARASLEATETDGAWTMTVTGPNPHVWLTGSPAGVTPTTHPILSFEYFATAPVPNLQVRVPFAEGAAHLRAGALPLAETWRPFGIDLRLAKEAYATGPGKDFALILGTEPGFRFQIRNLQLRAPNEEEARSEADRQERRQQREREAAEWLESLRRPYPGRITSVTIQAETIEVRADVKGRIRVGEATAVTGPTIPRFDGKRDRAADVFQIVDDAGVPLTPPARASAWEGQRSLPRLTAKGIKGLGGIPMNLTADHEIFALGIEHATVNIVVNALLRPGAAPGWAPWDFEGRTVHLNAGYLRTLDATVRTLSQKGVIVSAILLVGNQRDAAGRPAQPMIHPDALPEGTFAMPDVVTPEGAELYRAVIHLLTERYTREEGEFGRISNWILHNEVNQAGTWTNMGEQPMPRYVRTYMQSCRLVYLSARRFDPHARVFISLTHHWTELSGGLQTYVVRDLLELFAEAARVEGDFEWGVAYHPYPEPMTQPDVWKHVEGYDFDVSYITPKNIEVLPAYLAQERFWYQGKPRGILLSEQGINSVSLAPEEQERQAAGIVYTMERVRRIPAIEAFHYHAYRDSPEAEGGLLLGLTNPQAGHKRAWEIYAAIGTEREKEVTGFAWPLMGLSGPDAPELQIRPVAGAR
jgi:hypothetical protein